MGPTTTRAPTSFLPAVLSGITRIRIKNDNATDLYINNQNTGRDLQISQLAVYTMINGVETNIARGGTVGRSTATASSYPPELGPDIAIDGTLRPRSVAEKIFHSNGNTPQWWNLVLDQPYNIHKIVYYNRAECCQIRAQGVEVQFFNSSSNTIPIFTSILTSDLIQTIEVPNPPTTTMGATTTTMRATITTMGATTTTRGATTTMGYPTTTRGATTTTRGATITTMGYPVTTMSNPTTTKATGLVSSVVDSVTSLFKTTNTLATTTTMLAPTTTMGATTTTMPSNYAVTPDNLVYPINNQNTILKANGFDYNIRNPADPSSEPSPDATKNIGNKRIYSSFYPTNPAFVYYKSILDSPHGWSAGSLDQNQWIIINLDKPMNVAGIITQGAGSDYVQHVTSYLVECSIDGINWTDINYSQKNNTPFIGNVGMTIGTKNKKVVNIFPNTVLAQLVRIKPLTWMNHMTMRVAILTTVNSVTTITPTSTRPPTTASKSPFNNIESFETTIPSTTLSPTTTGSSPTILYTDVPPLITLPSRPYDRLRLFAANDTILFAIGCEPLANHIYYCNLINGRPISNNDTLWKAIQVPIFYKSIKKIVINDSCVFIYCDNYNGETNEYIRSIYYNVIKLDDDSNIISTWIQWDANILVTHNFTHIVVNNDVFIAFEESVSKTSFTIVTKVWWRSLQNKIPTPQKDNYAWYSFNFNDYVNVLSIVIYNNTLIGYNSQENDTIFMIELYGYNSTKSNFIDTATPTTLGSTTTTTTVGFTNNIALIANILFGLGEVGYFRTNTTVSVSDTITASSNLLPTTTRGSVPTTTRGSVTTTTRGSVPTTTRGSVTTTTRGSVPTTTSFMLPTTTASPIATESSYPSYSNFSPKANLSQSTTDTSVPTNPYDSINVKKDNVDFGMLLRGSNNQDNLNDFMAKNNILGSNIYISPMNNQNGGKLDPNSYHSKKSKQSKKNIDSYFYPMVSIV
jgi:hypothetical protein